MTVRVRRIRCDDCRYAQSHLGSAALNRAKGHAQRHKHRTIVTAQGEKDKMFDYRQQAEES